MNFFKRSNFSPLIFSNLFLTFFDILSEIFEMVSSNGCIRFKFSGSMKVFFLLCDFTFILFIFGCGGRTVPYTLSPFDNHVTLSPCSKLFSGKYMFMNTNTTLSVIEQHL